MGEGMLIYEETARVLVVQAGCLLVSQADGEPFAVLPGGHVERGETPLQALVREVREECGLGLFAASEVAVLYPRWRRGGKLDGDLVQETLHLYSGLLGGPVPEGVSRLGEPWLRWRWVPIPDLAQAQCVPLEVIPYAVQVGGVVLWR